jgi:cytochrome-b5 reductase
LALWFLFKPVDHSGPVIEPRKWRAFKLADKEEITHNVRRFRFDLPAKDLALGLPTGKHIRIRVPGHVDEKGKPIQKSYTPTSSDEDLGYFELVIKIYPDGALTPRLDALRIGDKIEVMGPLGLIEYQSPDRRDFTQAAQVFTPCMVLKGGKSREYRQIGMIAGGTGITPMYQILSQIERDNRDKTPAFLIFGNVSEDDILIREELDELVSRCSHIHVRYIVDRKTAGSDWPEQDTGYVNPQMIRDSLPPADDSTAIFLCGPPPMIKSSEKLLLDAGFAKEQIYQF